MYRDGQFHYDSAVALPVTGSVQGFTPDGVLVVEVPEPVRNNQGETVFWTVNYRGSPKYSRLGRFVLPRGVFFAGTDEEGNLYTAELLPERIEIKLYRLP